MANSSLIEKFENISKMLNKDIKQGQNNFANASLNELNEWKRIVEAVISKPGFDPNNQNHVNVRNKAERCLKAINNSIELRKQNYPIEEKIEIITNEVNKLRLKIDNLKKDLANGLKSLSEYNDLIQDLVEDYKILFDFAEGVFNSINEKFSEIRIDKRGDITRLRESLTSIKRDIVILKNWLIDAYNDKAYDYNEEFHDLKVTDEEKKKYNLPNEIDFIGRIQRYDNESFYKKTDISKLTIALGNLAILKANRGKELETPQKADIPSETVPEPIIKEEPIKEEKQEVNDKPLDNSKEPVVEENTKKSKKEFLVKKVKSAVAFYKKHRKVILYGAGLASCALSSTLVGKLIIPAVIFGNLVFASKEPKFEVAINLENTKLGNEKVSAETVINNLNDSVVKCGKNKEMIQNLRDKIVTFANKVKDKITNIASNNEELASNGIHR